MHSEPLSLVVAACFTSPHRSWLLSPEAALSLQSAHAKVPEPVIGFGDTAQATTFQIVPRGNFPSGNDGGFLSEHDHFKFP